MAELNVDADPEVLTVVVTVDGRPGTIESIRDHAFGGLELFRNYPGYLGGALHVSTDGTRLVQYLRWASEDEYRACIDDPKWDELPSTLSFLAAVDSGDARLEITLCRVVASS